MKHRVKVCFSGVLKVYCRNRQKHLLLPKSVFLIKMSHIRAKLSLSFEEFCGNKHINIYLKSIKFFSQQNEPHTAKLSFSSILKNFFRLTKQISLRSQCFSRQNEPHRVKVSFSGVLGLFCRLTKTFLYG